RLPATATPGSPALKNLFFTNGLDKVGAVQTDGNYLRTLATRSSGVYPINYAIPRGIAYDGINNKLYWAERDRIVRSNLDGSNIETVVNTSSPRSIAIDPVHNKLYWRSEQNLGYTDYSIYSKDLTTGAVRLVIRNSNFCCGLAVD